MNENSQEKQVKLEEAYIRLKDWIEDSLDQIKNDLCHCCIIYIVHIYLDLVMQDKVESAKNSSLNTGMNSQIKMKY